MSDENMNPHGIVNRPLVLPVHCKECVFFSTDAIYGKPCNKLGIIEESDPCHNFNQNVFRMKINDDPTVKKLLQLVGKIKSDVDIKRVIGILTRESRRRKQGVDLRLGQSVYIRVHGNDYLSNWDKGIVVGMAKESVGTKKEYTNDKDGKPVAKSKRVFKDVILVQGKGGWRAKIYRQGILTTQEWLVKKAQLVKLGKIKDPDLKKNSQEKKKKFKYESPTIDSNLGAVIKNKKKLHREFDIVSVRGNAA